MDIKKYIAHKKKIIDGALDKYLPSRKTKPQIIHKIMRYAVFPGGKRIRPILTLASFEACGGRGNEILPIACAIELIHTYTLIHDDLPCIDNDDYRRGRLSCHKKFSEGLALLAGDALLTLGFELLSEAGNIDIINEISKAIGSRGTVGGQVVDILNKIQNPSLDFARDRKSKIQKQMLHYIDSKKTGALFTSAVKVSGILKGVDKKKMDGLTNFGRDIGFIFQLVDDLIDGDGYVEIYGTTKTRKMADLLNKKIKGHLCVFGRKADRLLELSDLILNRKF